ncbi:hypothetical protein P4132_32145 [Pseudomonas aeruginosa]|nr:hypothetical protein [Pseudomonas aeruginosa]
MTLSRRRQLHHAITERPSAKATAGVVERFLPVGIGDQAADGGDHRIVITSA